MIGDETEYLQPVLGTLPSQRFKPMKSRWVAALLLILIVLVEISGIVSALYWPHTTLKCEPLYFILYCHAALWILVLFLDHGLKWHHNKLRLEGYLKAYEQMTKIGSLPFYIVSFALLGSSAKVVPKYTSVRVHDDLLKELDDLLGDDTCHGSLDCRCPV
ncbi:uncharacterized protein LOC128983964 [Macrosteles quadrilineatus]|uniref:uncharacterized protein LOC128983964 n=1 Tax=Macrosteles quadrilineatus TaxID=74068 RepID=UPI0023E21C0C|nr:uncharacterized protein LOC128983964 [Macrosteles quadrilineatus]